MTVAAYQGLYESSVAYGMRKALRSEQLKAELNKRTKEVEMQKLDLTRRVEELKKFCEDTENGFKENQAALEKAGLLREGMLPRGAQAQIQACTGVE